MNLNGFTEQQCQSLLDLAVLAMYADGHLAAIEDERVQQLLNAMDYGSDYDRAKHYDASLSRVSRHSQTTDEARAYASTLAQNFTDKDQRRQVHDVVYDLVTSDSKISSQENSYLAIVRQTLQM